ncbi:MAG: thiolase family protein [Deltaproteobacteria bacterium]|nr:thiolase family protein [Deltaproteobacteria bacterium]MBW2385495.1 thiolase family protein [Deltaproteobacteria bacterium]
MRLNAVVAGVGMTRFMKYPDKGLKELGTEASLQALADAGLETGDLDAAYVGNCAAGLITGQESIRGQVILDTIGIGKIPVINVENACASGSTAFREACAMVTAGLHDVVLALGVEKLSHPDKAKSFAAFAGAMDVDELQAMMKSLQQAAESSGAEGGAGQNRSMFMDVYASAARAHMEKYGTTVEQYAAVAAKNSFHGSLNPRAQFPDELSVEEVLAERLIVEPLTRAMCSPIGDGAAAVVVVSERKARELGISRPVRVETSVMRSGYGHAEDEPDTVQLASRDAYEASGLGPDDFDLIEIHDASAPGEIIAYEQLGLCAKGDGGRLVESGETRLGGRRPVNTSGGLLRKGHPVGATGAAQIVELTEQLQGRAGRRQVEGARVALAQNGGGKKGNDAAAMVVTILKV